MESYELTEAAEKEINEAKTVLYEICRKHKISAHFAAAVGVDVSSTGEGVSLATFYTVTPQPISTEGEDGEAPMIIEGLAMLISDPKLLPVLLNAAEASENEPHVCLH